MSTQRIDRILLLLGALLIFISSYQLFIVISRSSSKLETLGTLSGAKATVKTKNALALDWQDAFVGNRLSEDQLIYTDTNSQAEVKFVQGDELIIGENSLIKLKTLGKTKGLDVEQGFIRAKLSGGGPLLIEMNGEEYRLSGSQADVQINVNGDNGEIGVFSGEVKVERDGVLENINSSSALEVRGKEVTKKAIIYQLIHPQRDFRVYTALTSMPMNFNWAPGDGAQVSIANNSQFKDAEILNGQGSASTTLAPGTYYWKVESKLGSSLTGQFTILSEVSPRIIRPKNDEMVTLLDGPGEPTLLLQWVGEGTQKYLVEWHDSSVHRDIVQGPRALIKELDAENFKWRVKIENLNRPDALWSSWQNIKLKIASLPTVPIDLAPHEWEFQTYEKPQEKIEMTWKSDSSVEWELLGPKGNKETQIIKSESHEYVATETGSYRWRLRGIDNFGRVSEWSDWKIFTIEDLSNMKTAEGIQRIQLKRPDQEVEFSWKSDEGSNNVFELSKDEGFTDVISKQKLKSSSIKVTIPVVGTYFWRSRQFLPDGKINVSEPKKVIIEPAPQMIKPEKLPNVEVPIEWKVIEKKSGSFWDFIISPVYADDEIKGVAHISFPPNDDAKSYVIRIYGDSDLKNLVLEKEIEESHFDWEDVTPGTYHWQYAIIDHWNRKSEFSDPSSLTVLEVKMPEAERPKLLWPIRNVEITKDTPLFFCWTLSDKNSAYEFFLSSHENFEKKILSKKIRTGEFKDPDLKLGPGQYFWKVEAQNKWKRKRQSSVGRFLVVLPKEKTKEKSATTERTIETKKYWRHTFKGRVHLGWSPSMDNYTFEKSNTKGNIDGNALNGINLGGSYFMERWILSGEFLRQSGKVFESQDYLFQRLLADGVYAKKFSHKHRLGMGLALGQTSGQEYDFQNGTVKGNAVSALSFGLMVRDFYALSPKAEIQSRFMYLAGEIKQIEIGGDYIRHFKKYFGIAGVSYSMRGYKLNEGSQSSLRLMFGVGKDF